MGACPAGEWDIPNFKLWKEKMWREIWFRKTVWSLQNLNLKAWTSTN